MSAGRVEHSRPARARLVLAILAGLIPLVPIVIGFVISSGRVRAAPVSTPFAPVAPKSAPLSPSASLPPGSGALVALVLHRTTMRLAPGGARLAMLPTRTEFGSPEVLLVARHTARWLGVLSPLAGNGRLGWIPRSAVALGRISWELKVSLSARRLEVLDGGTVMARYTVAIGRPDAPTPTGRFAVTDRLITNDPSGPYGCCIIALSAHSPHAIQGWGGGDRIAIHSTPDTKSIGLAVSHGCLRLTTPEGRWLINHVPLGTPTLIGD